MRRLRQMSSERSPAESPACTCPKLIAPAMNTRMFRNPIVQENIAKLGKHGYVVIQPEVGMLACRDVGEGKLPSEDLLLDYILLEIAREKDMKGMKVLVTAGPTVEAVDPVRYITNHSTGKMGYALARACMLRGAQVTLITGPTTIPKPRFVETVPITSAKEMFDAVVERFKEQDLIIKAAAVADYRPKQTAQDKIKKQGEHMALELERTDDILQYLGDHKKAGQFLCGFSMETKDMLENSRKKLKKKNLDMIVANNLKVKGAGFGTDTNVITMLTEREEVSLPLLTKEEAANRILDQILSMKESRKE